MGVPSLSAKVRNTITENGIFQPSETVLVGVSGGPDSLCLLMVLHGLSRELGLKLQVAHLNHGLRGQEAEADAALAAQVAARCGVPCTVGRCDVAAYRKRHKLSLEDAAREVRYAFFARLARSLGAQVVAVGHTADDQVETILIHWLRGAGMAGLRGMTPVQELTVIDRDAGERLDVRLARPLLDVTRQETLEYCAQQGLSPRLDRSNLDLRYLRNRVRWQLIPALEAYNPNLRQTLLRAARSLALDHGYLSKLAQEAWPRIIQEADGLLCFSRHEWGRLHPSLQGHLLRLVLARLWPGWQDFGWGHVAAALEAIRARPPGTTIVLPHSIRLTVGHEDFVLGHKEAVEGYWTRRQRQRADFPLLFAEEVAISCPGITRLPDSPWQLVARVQEAGEAKALAALERGQERLLARFDYALTGDRLVLRRRRPGDRFQPLGMKGTKKLQDYLVDAKVPRELRDYIPVIANPRQIIWVGGWRADGRVKPSEGTRRALHLEFTKVG